MQVCAMLHRVYWLCVVDKSGGQEWYVNMCAGLARYSQLLLHDLSRDLMLISKKTESCRLSIAAFKSEASPEGTNFTRLWSLLFHNTHTFHSSQTCTFKKKKMYTSHTCSPSLLTGAEHSPPQVQVKGNIPKGSS